jgi:hypothetical protein
MSVRADTRTAFYWYAALDLARMVAGADLSEAEAAEYVIADFLSGGVPLPADTPPCYPSRPPLRFPGRRGGPWVVARSRPVASLAAELGSPVLDSGLSKDLEQALALIDADVERDPFEMDATMRRVVAARSGLDLDLARLLRNFRSLGLERHIGFESFEEYVVARLGISARRARFLARLDYALYGLPAVKRAVREGRIGTVAALRLTRIVRANDNEEIWIERAERITVARLRREVEWAERRLRLSGFRDTPLPPENGRLNTALDDLTAEILDQRQTFASVNAEPRSGGATEVAVEGQHATGETGFAELSGQPWQMFAVSGVDGVNGINRVSGISGVGVNGIKGISGIDGIGEFNGVSTVGGIGVNGISGVAGANGVNGVNGDSGSNEVCTVSGVGVNGISGVAGINGVGGFNVDVEFWLAESVADLWQEARRQIAHVTGDRSVWDWLVMHWIALDFLATHLPLWLEAHCSEDPIAVREQFRCLIPGCTVHGGAGHHIIYRSRGGPDLEWNIGFVCYTHHIPAIHGGHVRVSGTAPDGLKVELGIRPDGTALETVVNGERVQRSNQTEADLPGAARLLPDTDPAFAESAISPKNPEASRRGNVAARVLGLEPWLPHPTQRNGIARQADRGQVQWPSPYPGCHGLLTRDHR